MRKAPNQVPTTASAAHSSAAADENSWRRWIGPLIALIAVIVLGLILHHKLRNDVWAYYTDGENLRVDAREKKERMVLWEDPQQHLFEQQPSAEAPRSRDRLEQASQERVEAAFSPDGAMMVLTRWTKRTARATDTNADLYLSSWNGRTWSQPTPIVDLNTRSNERGAAFSRDGQYLYFSSDRAGGSGGYDLYVARSDGNKWTAVTSLGKSINSARNESGPAPSADGDRLYFSSDRNANESAQDIFVAKLLGGKKHSNTGTLPPVPAFGEAKRVDDLNSPANDIEAALTNRGSYVFLASDRDRNSSSGFNLYLSRVIDGRIQPPQKVDVYIRRGNATDPAVRMEGFDLLFSADGDLAASTNEKTPDAATPQPAYRLYRSTTREVIGYTDLSRWELFKELIDKIQWLILLAIASLLSLIYLLEKWRDITSLFHKCLAASAGVHLVLLMFMMFWLITQAIEEGDEQPAPEVAISVDALAQEELAMESEQELAEVIDTTQMVVTKSEQEFAEATFEPQEIVDNPIPIVPKTFDQSLVSEVKQSDASESTESEPILQPMDQFSKLVELTPVELPVSAVEAMESAELPNDISTKPVDPTKDDFQRDEVAIQQVESQKANVEQAASRQLDVQADTETVARSDEVSKILETQTDLVQPTSGLEAIDPAPELAGSIAPIELSVVAMETMETAEMPRDNATQPVDPTQGDFQPDGVDIQQVESQKANVAQTTSGQLDVQAEADSVARSNSTTSSSDAQDDLIQPTSGLEAIDPTPELAGSIAPLELSVVAVEAMESAEIPSDNATQPVDPTRDDFQPDRVTIQQVESQKANVAQTTSGQLDVQAEAESVARSDQVTDTHDPQGDTIQPTSGLEAIDPTPELAGSIAPIELSVVAVEAMESAEVPSDNRAQPVDPTRDDFQPDGVAIQQVESQKANVAKTTSGQLDVQAESESVARSDQVTDTHDPQGDTILPTSGLEATGAPAELAVGEALADLAANLPGGDAMEIPGGEALEAPERLDIGAIGKHIKQQRGNLSDEIIEQLGGSKGTERAIGLGLDWFTDHQESDGRWEMSKYQGNSEDNIAGVGLALLCYYGWGIKHGSYADNSEHDRHARSVTKALDWLLKQQKADGSLLGSTTNHGMYCHGIAAVALCEGYGLTRDPELKKPATKAIEYILNSQHEGGGWRYRPREPGDLSVTGWQYLALHSARMADIDVPDEAFTKTGKFLDSVSGGTHGGYYGYLLPEKNKPTMTATGMFLRQLDGTPPTAPNMQESASVLKSKMLEADTVDFYFDYYATLALYQHQGPIWQEWNENLKEIYVTLQISTGPDKGSWDPKGNFVKTGGRVVSTGLAILSLEVYYRLLPMYGYDRAEDTVEAQTADP